MSVDTPSAEYGAMQERWRKARDCIEGGHAVKERGATYLPPLAGHNPGDRNDEYWSYNGRALYYNASGRTIDGLVGMVFRRPPVTKGIEEDSLAAALGADIDMVGRSLEDLGQILLRDVISVGRSGLLADHTRQDVADKRSATPGTGTSSNLLSVPQYQRPEAMLKLDVPKRPYMRLYATEQILDVVYTLHGGVPMPVQVRLYEQIDKQRPDDEFEVEIIDQVRVLELTEEGYQQRIFQKELSSSTDGSTAESFVEKETIKPTDRDGERLQFIPFWIVSMNESGAPMKIDPPPLLDLFECNLTHYRQDADYRNALHKAGVPTAVISGMDVPSQPVRVGSDEIFFMPPADSKAYYMSYGGEGVASIREALRDLESQMAFLGARMLQPEKRGVEAAETARIHRMGEISVLGAAANMVSKKLTSALKFLMEWGGVKDVTDVMIQLNNDFLPQQAPAQLLSAMVGAWQGMPDPITGEPKQSISHDSLWRFLQEGELVDPRRTSEQEMEQILRERGSMPRPALQRSETPMEFETITASKSRKPPAAEEEEQPEDDEEPAEEEEAA